MDETLELVDQYIDRFLSSDHTIIMINDENYPGTFLNKRLQARIREREIRKLISYVFMNTLYLEKI
ncbi:hypothetical protein HOC87_12935 [Candidatus Bathyarchaeota archaeon]|nr:hypothetical protein [Candidatus Bathyarchaeota archaeon]